MILFNLNTRQFLLFSALISVLFLASCATGKKTTIPPPPVVVVPDTIEHYSCGFSTATYTGHLPCFGDECNDWGAPLTMIFFNTKQVASKKLKTDRHIMKNISGKWSINNECIIEVNYEDGTQEFYKFHEDIHKIERLTSNKTSFPGTLNKHNYLSKI